MLSTNGWSDTFKQFINGNALYAIIIVVFLTYIYKLNRKEKKVAVITVLLMIIVIFNPISYDIIANKLNHSAQYYRFMWIIPYGLILAYGIGEIIANVDKKVRLCFTLIVCASIIIISVPKERLKLPDNRYQIPLETIDVANELERLRVENEKEQVWVITDANIANTIRQYNANICYSVNTFHIYNFDKDLNEETVNGLCSMLMYNRNDISAEAIKDIVVQNNVDYLVVSNENQVTLNYLYENGWISSGDTEQYTILELY